MKRIIKINSKSFKPKYQQIIDSINNSIEKGKLKKGDKVPSINEVCKAYNLSRDTVLVGFSKLKARGILKSQPGKGYYINNTDTHREERIFVLFDELNAFKEDLYNSLLFHTKEKAKLELFFHHFNYNVYKNLIHDCIGNYTSYVIMPATFDNTSHLLKKLPQDKIFILDRFKTDLKEYPVVYQDFGLDFYEALKEGTSLLKKYRKLVFVHPGGKEPIERINGFEKYCKEYNFKYQVIKSINEARPGLYEAWFLTSDRDLVNLVKLTKSYNYNLGKKFGIVSFNDTMLKEVVAGGITTISTDFKQMGKTLASMLLSNKKLQARNPSKLIIRKSL